MGKKLLLGGDVLFIEGQPVEVIGRGFKFAGAYITNVEVISIEAKRSPKLQDGKSGAR